MAVNGDRYRAMLKDFLFTKIEVRTALCATRTTLDVLLLVFKDRISSRRADVVGAPRCYDLTPLGYYLWGAVKNKCYANKPKTIYA